MDENGFDGEQNCRLSNAAAKLQYGNPKLAGCYLPSPYPQWPPEHQTTATLVPSSTVSRISSALLQTSGGALTSTASAKTLQYPSAAIPTGNPGLRSSRGPQGPASVTRLFPSSIRYSTATIISVSPTPSASSSPVLVTAAPSTTDIATTAILATSVQSPAPQLSLSSQIGLSMTETGSTSLITPTALAAAPQQSQSQSVPFEDTTATMSTSSKTNLVIGLVVGIVLGAILFIVPVTYYIYRRHMRNQAHRRSIGAIEADEMFRPWKKSSIDLKRKTANMALLYRSPSEKGSELSMPPPVFAPLRANRSSSVYSGSMLNGFQHLTPQAQFTPMPRTPEADRKSFYSNDSESIRSLPYEETKRSSSLFSGYVYSEDPFEAPLIAHESPNPTSVVTIRKLPKEYKGKIKMGMGVQRK